MKSASKLKVKSPTNLKLRGETYYARLIVPEELQQLMGKRELIRSLNNKDRRTANVRKLPVLAKWHDDFSDLRSRRHISESDFAQATWQHYSDALRHDELVRVIPGDTDKSPVVRQHHLRALREHLGVGETVLVHWAADSYIERNRLLVEKGPPPAPSSACEGGSRSDSLKARMDSAELIRWTLDRLKVCSASLPPRLVSRRRPHPLRAQ